MATDANVQAAMQILKKWNPLGERASEVKDLDGYRLEAEDLLFQLESNTRGWRPERVVRELINEAFDLKLAIDDCKEPAQALLKLLAESVPATSVEPTAEIAAEPTAAV